jgi:peptidoglycan hydrolase FlgJ
MQLPSLSSQVSSAPGAASSILGQPTAASHSVATKLDWSSSESANQPGELKAAFRDFVGQTFFGELIKSFRSTQQPAAYMNGGRAEEIFRGQFDQVLSEKLSDASSGQIADPMFELFMLKRR